MVSIMAGKDRISLANIMKAAARTNAARIGAIVAMVTIPAIMIVVGLLLSQEYAGTAALRAEVDHSYETRAQIQTILSVHQDMETGQRGYLVTGNRDFLKPYELAVSRLSTEFAALERNVKAEGLSKVDLDALHDLSRRKTAFIGRSIALRESGDAAGAAQLVSGGEGKALMDAIRVRIATMAEEERARLEEKSGIANAASVRAQWITYVLLAVLALALVISTAIIARVLRARKDALDSLRDSSARSRAILDSAIDSIITLNPSGSIEGLNPAAERMYGYASDELVRRDVGLLFAEPPAEGAIQAFLRSIVDAGSTAGQMQEIMARRSDGASFATDVAVSPMPLADGMHFVAVIRDITERKRVEQMKSEFVSTVSHELRTPLTSIAGSLGLLAGGAAGELPDRAGRLVSIAHSNSERLVRLINDILDIEKIESGGMVFDNQPIALDALLADTVDANRGFARQYDVAIRLEPVPRGVRIKADSDRMAQVLTNLLSNAIKFSPKGETVVLSVYPGEKRHRISVRDNGPGIPENFQPHIFGKFAQADASDTRAKGGTGLGLNIVRQIVTRLGGRVTFETGQGIGTVFHVDLPAYREDADVVPDHRPRLLICEGDQTSAEQIAGMLAEAGFASDVASDVREAEALAGKTRHVAFLIDLSVPGDGGIALIRKLRADPRHAATPIIVISADSERTGAVGDAMMIVDWLQKPLSSQDLVETVRRALAAAEGGQPRVLHVDDDPDVLRVVSSAFEGRVALTSVTSLETARAALSGSSFDLVILDLGLADGSGLELLPDLRGREGRLIPVVVFSAQDADPELAREVDAMLTKSRASLARLVETVESYIVRTEAA